MTTATAASRRASEQADSYFVADLAYAKWQTVLADR